MVKRIIILGIALLTPLAFAGLQVSGGISFSGNVAVSNATDFDFSFALASDIHVGRPNSFSSGEPAANFSQMLSGGALGVICTGDITENSGVTQTVYMASVAASYPGKLFKFLAGNHDACPEIGDDGEGDAGTEVCSETYTNFNFYLNNNSTNRYWAFDVGKYRFVGFDSQIIREGANQSLGRIPPSDFSFVTNELAIAAAANRPVLLFSHYPLLSDFGNQIYDNQPLLAAMTNSGKVVAYLSGHRHLWAKRVTNGNVLHVSVPGLAYSTTALDPPYSVSGGYLTIGVTNDLLTFNLYSAAHPTYTLRDTFVYPVP